MARILKSVLLLTIAATFVEAPSLFAQTAACPNEPPGSTVLLDCTFDHPTCNGRIGDPYGSAGRSLNVVNNQDGPVSGPSAIESRLTYPNKSGGTQLDFMAPAQIRNVYVCFYWKPSNPFGGNLPGANKTFFIRDGFSSNGVFYWAYRYNEATVNPGNVNLGDYFWDSQFEGLNAHTCGLGGRACWPNTGKNVKIVPGNWYRIEVRMIGGATGLTKDSQLHMWINGVKTLQYTDLQYPPTYQNAWTWSETWDGYGNGTVPAGYTSDQSHFIDHLRISTVGGGIVPPPPPPPPSPVPPLPPPPPPPPVQGTPGSVSNLAAAQTGPNSVTLSFNQVDDGTSAPAKYDIRQSATGALWGGGTSVAQGTCSSPLQGTATSGTLTCTVTGLSPSTKYDFQLVAFRGTMNQGAVYGGLSNVASATTAAAPAGSATDVNGDGSTNITDVQLGINQLLGITACGSADANKDGTCNVIDVQMIVNKALSP